MRRLLRYEITGLFIITHAVLVSFLFLELNDILDLIRYFIHSAVAIGLISLLIGWLAYQVFEICYRPHYKTSSFELIRDIRPNLKKSECFTIGDYILMDDMYQKYRGLGDTFGGYWDNYYANSMIGLGVPIVSFFLFIILLVVRGIDLLVIEWADCTDLRLIYLAILISYNAYLCNLLWRKNASKIFEEIEFQECLHTMNNIYKLDREPLRNRMTKCSHLSTKNRHNK